MGTITPYETVKGRRYRVRYRKPDHTETQKRGFTTMREAKLYLSMVTVSKSKGEYIDPSSSRVPVRMFAESWLRSKHPPMSKPSYYMTLEQEWRNHVAPIWADREIWSIRRSEVQDWVSALATQKSRTVVLRALGVLAGILDVAIDDRRLMNNPARHIRNLPSQWSGQAPRVPLARPGGDAGGVLGAPNDGPDTGVYRPALGRGYGAAGAQH